MIKENTEPKDEQLTTSTVTTTTPTNFTSTSAMSTMTSPASMINQTVHQRASNNHKWKQISLQGLDLSPQQTQVTSPSKLSTTPLNSITQRVNDLV